MAAARRLVFGDATVLCMVCRVSVCHSSHRFCQGCGAALAPGVLPLLPEFQAISIEMAHRHAAQYGETVH